MATNIGLMNPNVELGSAVDIRMTNGTNIVPSSTPSQEPSSEVDKNAKYCPDGGTFLGIVKDKPLCFTPPKPYAYNPDKQAAYEKAQAQGIPWSGQYTKDVITGEVTPKTPEQAGADELKAKLEEQAAKLNAQIPNLPSQEQGKNFIQKYWWILGLAAIGYIVLGKKD